MTHPIEVAGRLIAERIAKLEADNAAATARLAEFLAADREQNATIDEHVRTINRLGSDYYRLRTAAWELLSVVDEEHPDWQPARLSMAMQTVREAISAHDAGTVAAVNGQSRDDATTIEALMAYVSHQEGCMRLGWQAEWTTCTCGLTDVLRGIEARKAGRIVDTNHPEAPDTSGDDDGN